MVAVVPLMSGCLDQDGGGRSPLAGPPKLVLDHGPDNLTELYVHASLGEVNYDRITLRVDNATAGEEGFFETNHSYSLDVKVNRTRFHLNVTVLDGLGDGKGDTGDADVDRFGLEAVVRLNVTGGSATLRLPAGNGDGDGETAEGDLPFSRLLGERRAGEAG